VPGKLLDWRFSALESRVGESAGVQVQVQGCVTGAREYGSTLFGTVVRWYGGTVVWRYGGMAVW
jgi:hypothetical protein